MFLTFIKIAANVQTFARIVQDFSFILNGRTQRFDL